MKYNDQCIVPLYEIDSVALTNGLCLMGLNSVTWHSHEAIHSSAEPYFVISIHNPMFISCYIFNLSRRHSSKIYIPQWTCARDLVTLYYIYIYIYIYTHTQLEKDDCLVDNISLNAAEQCAASQTTGVRLKVSSQRVARMNYVWHSRTVLYLFGIRTRQDTVIWYETIPFNDVITHSDTICNISFWWCQDTQWYDTKNHLLIMTWHTVTWYELSPCNDDTKFIITIINKATYTTRPMSRNKTPQPISPLLTNLVQSKTLSWLKASDKHVKSQSTINK